MTTPMYRYTDDAHPCEAPGCPELVAYDDEPYCLKSVLAGFMEFDFNNGSNVRGYSYKAAHATPVDPSRLLPSQQNTGLSVTNINILQSDHYTATVTTRTGQHYTIVARPYLGVLLINDDTGVIKQGSYIRAIGCLFLHDSDDLVARTTTVEHVYIMSN